MGSAAYALERIPSESADRHWELYRGWLELVPHHHLYTLDHMRAWVREGKRQLWAVFDATVPDEPRLCACVVTGVEDYPLRRVGRILLCGGTDMVQWLGLLEQLEQAFRDAGCERIEVYGRRGWERVLPNYRLQAVVLAKEL